VASVTSGDSGTSALVSVLVVTYETPSVMLRGCIDSVSASSYRPVELIVVDNSRSSVVGETMRSWDATAGASLSRLAYLPQGRNLGYAAATNLGIAASRGALLLMLNPDAVLEPAALSELVSAANRRPQGLGFAPKVSLEAYDGILDSVGIDLLIRGEGSQRGLGEPDLGQYDIEERVAGLCFAAALIRRSGFADDVVGRLDERYFMFYEDVDWSIRAGSRGEEFWTVPTAHVSHVHSASTRHMAPKFKSRLIQRNLIWTAAKNLERPRVARVLVRHSLRSLASGFRGRRPLSALRVTAEAWAGLPRLIGSRRECQKRRSLSDLQVLSKVAPESSFDVGTYRPAPTVHTLVSVLSRSYVVAPDPVLRDLVTRIRLAAKTSTATDGRRMAQLVRESGVQITPRLEWLLGRLEVDRQQA
jgi:GT2 family glycosyltransferase